MLQTTNTISKFSLLRGRLIMGINTFMALAVTYSQRQTVNVVIAQIVSISGEPDKIQWTKLQKAVVLMSFYAGYLCTQVVGGIMAEKYGPKKTFFISILLSSISCIATPAALENSPYTLVVLRILMGLSQAFFLPCLLVIIANWFPPNIRTTAIGLMFPGTFFGTILSLLITSGLAHNNDLWRVSFYIFGGFGILWMISWVIFTTDDPQNNKWITQEEKDYLKQNVEREQVSNYKDFPVKQMLLSMPVWAVVWCHFAACWSLFLIVTVVPSMILDLYKIQVKDQTFMTFLTPVLTWCGGVSFCRMADIIQEKKLISKIKMRKIFNIFSLIPVGAFLMFSTLCSPEKYQVGVFLILVACFFSGVHISITLANIGDIAPQYYGIVVGIANTTGSLAGIIAIQTAYVFISDTHQPHEWQYTFSMMLVVEIICFILFNVYAKGDIQPWAIQKKSKDSLTNF